MAFLNWLQQTALATWIHESTSMLAFPTILTFHTFGMGLLAGAAAMVDLRILGVAPLLPVKALEPLLRVVWLGFWINLVSGTLLFMAAATMHAQNPAFYVKLAFVVLGMAALQVMRREVFQSNSPDAAPVSSKARALAVLSLIFWTGAITAGRLMAYVGSTR